MVIHKKYNETYESLINLNDNLYDLRKRRKPELKPEWLKDEEEIQRISLSRTKRRIKEICLCNDFQYFVTMTVSSKIKEYNRFELEECILNCRKHMRKIKRISTKEKGNFKYIFVTEKHENGAYHFHGMMRDLPKDDIYVNDNGYLSSHLLDGLGFNSFSAIKEYNKACTYITKYITKENMVRNEKGTIFFASKGLKRPSEEVMINIDLLKIFEPLKEGDIVKENKVFSNKYCQKVDFQVDRLSRKQREELMFYYKENEEYFKNDKNYMTIWLQLFTNLGNSVNIEIHK